MTKRDHQALVDVVRAKVVDGPGETPMSLRQAAAAWAAGHGPPITEPLEALVKQIGDAAYRVTDAQVKAVARERGESAAFEVIVAAALGAGLHRWDRGLAVLEEASRAPS